MADMICRGCGLSYRMGRHRNCFEVEQDRRKVAEAMAMFTADIAMITESDIERMYMRRWARRKRETPHGG